jgi:hypothetical protein
MEYGVDDGDRTHDNRSHNPALYQLSYAHHNAFYLSQDRQMARPAGLEPATIRLEGGCSIQLSYGRLSVCRCRLKAFGFGKNFADLTFTVLPSDLLCSTSGANVIALISGRQQGNLKKISYLKELRENHGIRLCPAAWPCENTRSFFYHFFMVNQA